MKIYLIAAALFGAAASLHAATIPLNSTMDGSGYMAEDIVTGGFSRINLGDGKIGTAGFILNPASPNYPNSGDRDGHYNWNGSDNPALISSPVPLGSGWDLFPRETNFTIGTLTYNDAGFTGIGIEVFSITSLDLSAFWTSDPNRTNSTPGNLPTVISDISDHAIGLWLFGGAGGISFGALDAADTVTFTNGALTSIDLQVTTAFSANAFASSLVWDGTFSISGADLSYQIHDSASTFIGPSTFVADLKGTVNAVVPEPSSLALLALAGAALGCRRFRRPAR